MTETEQEFPFQLISELRYTEVSDVRQIDEEMYSVEFEDGAGARILEVRLVSGQLYADIHPSIIERRIPLDHLIASLQEAGADVLKRKDW